MTTTNQEKLQTETIKNGSGRFFCVSERVNMHNMKEKLLDLALCMEPLQLRKRLGVRQKNGLPDPAVLSAAHRSLPPGLAAGRRKNLLQSRVFVLTYIDNEYPKRLLDLPDPPLVLFCRGSSRLLAGPAIGIVGARKASPYGLRTARSFARHVAGQGVAVVSGLALGIDGAAHRGALEAHGPTISVLGSGLDRIYPAAHAPLAGKIAQEGLLLSEYPPDTPPARHRFPERNRIVSALSDRLLVVEAGEKSGSLITAGFSLELGRDVFCVPGDLDRPVSRGTNRLIADGAIPALEPEDLLAFGWPEP